MNSGFPESTAAFPNDALIELRILMCVILAYFQPSTGIPWWNQASSNE